MNKFGEAMAWFCVKYRYVAKLIFVAIPVFAIALCSSAFGLHIAIAVVIALVVGFYMTFFVANAPLVLLRAPLARIGDGDPLPLLNTTRELLKHVNGNATRLLIVVYRSIALCMVGEFELASAELKATNIESNKAATVPIKLFYYNSLADTYFFRGEYDKYEIWYEQYLQMYSGLKEGKRKDSLKNSHKISNAQYCISKGEYTKALELLCSAEATVELTKVDIAYYSAMAHIGLGNNEQAKRDLLFVTSYNRDIYVVRHARELLEELDKDSAKKNQDIENLQ